MKVLLVDKFHYRFGGAERAYFDTADVLMAHGHEVAFFAMQHPQNEPTPWSRFFVSQVDYGRDDYTLWQKVRMAARMIWNREAQKKLEALLEEFRPDVAHLHLIYHQLSPSIIWTLAKHRIPMVMTLHDYKHISPNYNLFVRGKVWERAPYHCVGDRCVRDSVAASAVCTLEHYVHAWIGTYAKVNRYIAPSRFLIETSKRHGFTQEIAYVPQPLSPAEFNVPQYQREDYILYIGRLSHEKGVRVLLDAFAASRAPRLIVAGTGPDEDALKAHAQTLPGAARITFAGFVAGAALTELAQKARAVVVPSLWYENAPYALLEALAAGNVVIAAASGGITERIVHGKNGFLYPPRDTQALTRLLDALSDIDDARIRAAARASVANLTHERYYTDLMTVYRDVVHLAKRAI